jgi:membrane-associated phospholipid phosphatase
MFFTSYLLFFLFPIEGPRWFQVSQYINPVRGFVFRPLVEFIQHKGAVHGGGMPSSHTGVALVITMYTYRFSKRWGLILAVIVTGLGVGALWGRYHYISDIIVGAIIGLFSVFIADRFLRSRIDNTHKLHSDRSAVAHVS